MVLSRFRGCLLGVAVGDALGAPVEFIDARQIERRFGPEGVTGFEAWRNEAGILLPAGSVTDDTQMTLATAAGLLAALPESRRSGILDVSTAVWNAYVAWESTQQDPVRRRYPGATCLSAVRAGTPGDVDDPVNDSKGCGGVMRVAPVGLAFEPEPAFEIGAATAALTHGHPTGFLSAGFLAGVVSRLVRGPRGGVELQSALGGALPAAIAEMRELLLGYDDNDETLGAVDMAVEFFMAGAPVEEAVARLGQGWVAEEALSIGLFAALSFPGDFEAGVLAAVNITGDSDSTGAVAGALLGAALGEGAVPYEWATQVESGQDLLAMASSIYSAYVEDGVA